MSGPSAANTSAAQSSAPAQTTTTQRPVQAPATETGGSAKAAPVIDGKLPSAPQEKASKFELATGMASGAILSLKTGFSLLGESLGKAKAAASLLSSAYAGAQPLTYGLLFAGLINQLKDGATQPAMFALYAAGFGATQLLGSLLESLDRKWNVRRDEEAQQRAFLGLRRALYARPYEDLKVAHMANTISQVNENMWRFPRLMDATKDSVKTAVTLTFAAIAIGQAPWPVVCCALASAVIPIVQNLHVARRATRDDTVITEPRRKVWWLSYMITDTSGAKDVRVLGVKNALEERREEARQASTTPGFLRANLDFLYSVASNPVSTACMVTSIYLLSKGVAAGSVSLGVAMLVATQAYPAFAGALSQVTGLVGRLIETAPHVKNYRALAGTKNAFKREVQTIVIPENWNSPETKAGPKVDAIPAVPSLELVSVAYAYPDSKGTKSGTAPVLQGLNFTIAAGETVMLCGGNGAGKSTLLELLVGLRQPTDGALMIDGKPLASKKESEWAQSLGICFQDFYLFGSLTFREILSLGAKPVSDTYVEKVLDVTGVTTLLNSKISEGGTERFRFPLGLDSIYGAQFRNGVELSVGERQKFAVARALLRRPAVLVLDEFTSALDPEDVNRLYGFLSDREEHMGYKPTLIFSTHDYKKGAHAERIIMLAKDKYGIAASGTFDELAAAEGDFQRKLQASTVTGRPANAS